MILSATWVLQTALFTRLSASAELQALIGQPARVYDDAPRNAIFPFLTIGQTRVRDYPGADGVLEHEIRLNAYSRWGGRAEVKQISGHVYDLLHEREIPLEGARLSQLRFVFADVIRRPDPETFHAVMRYRAITEPTVHSV